MDTISEYNEIKRIYDYVNQAKDIRSYYEEKIKEINDAKEIFIFYTGPYKWKQEEVKNKINEYNDQIDQIKQLLEKLNYVIEECITYYKYYDNKPIYFIKN